MYVDNELLVSDEQDIKAVGDKVSSHSIDLLFSQRLLFWLKI